MLERERTHLLRQVDGMAAHDRTEGATTAAELRHAGGTVTSTTGALLLVHLLAGAPDLGAALGLVRAGLTLGELPVNAALNQILARLEAEDRIGRVTEPAAVPSSVVTFSSISRSLLFGRRGLGRSCQHRHQPA